VAVIVGYPSGQLGAGLAYHPPGISVATADSFELLPGRTSYLDRVFKILRLAETSLDGLIAWPVFNELNDLEHAHFP
jgi:hypothetical protein